MVVVDQLDLVVCMGTKMQGKSTLARQILDFVPPMKRAIYDFTGFFKEYAAPGKSLYYYRVRYGEMWEAETFMETVYNLGNCFVIFDEADLYFDEKNHFLQTFLVTIRNRLGGAFVICKRPFAITTETRSLVNKIICFRIKSPHEIAHIAKITGQPVSKLMEILPFLQPGQHVVFDMDTYDMSPVIRYPLK